MSKTICSEQEKLTSYLLANRPIIYIRNFDFEVVDELILAACKETGFYEESDIEEYNNADGIVHFKTKCSLRNLFGSERMSSAEKLYHSLSMYSSDIGIKNVVVLKDIHEELHNSLVVSRIKSIALRAMRDEECQIALIIVSTKTVIPFELEKYITVLDIHVPEREEIEEYLKDYCKAVEMTIDDSLLSELSLSFKGLSRFEIKQILDLAYLSGSLKKDKELILQEKEASIKKSGMLEAVRVKDDISQIGGLKNLVEYLKRKAAVFTNMAKALDFGVDIPKGILIVGMPGCGKSLTAKAAATLFNAPLLRLDVGRLLGKYVGESEENLRLAISIAEAATPCVLWIDEIEKAFAGVGRDEGGGGVTTRLFGYFLTWMQEKESTVYVVATANDISSIPPEFLRRGRFDEIFSVDLPNDKEREQIFEIHLTRRKKKLWRKYGINVEDLVIKTRGKNGNEYSGADIESIVKTAIETAFENNRELTQEDLLDAINKTIPIAKTMSKKIETLKRCLEQYQIKNASSE